MLGVLKPCVLQKLCISTTKSIGMYTVYNVFWCQMQSEQNTLYGFVGPPKKDTDTCGVLSNMHGKDIVNK